MRSPSEQVSNNHRRSLPSSFSHNYGNVFSYQDSGSISHTSDDCRSVSSMPLLKDDDYYYYHGHDDDDDADEKIVNSEDEDEDPVDHITALIRPKNPYCPPQQQPSSRRGGPRAIRGDYRMDEKLDGRPGDQEVLQLLQPSRMRRNNPRPRVIPKQVVESSSGDDDAPFRFSLQSQVSEFSMDEKLDDGGPYEGKNPAVLRDNSNNNKFGMSELTCDFNVEREPLLINANMSLPDKYGSTIEHHNRITPQRRHRSDGNVDSSSCSEDITIQDVVRLKVRVAELESQLQVQTEMVDMGLTYARQNDSLRALLIDAIKEVDQLKRKNLTLSRDNRKLKKNASIDAGLSLSFKRRCTTGDLISPYPEVDTNNTKSSTGNKRVVSTSAPFPSRRPSAGGVDTPGNEEPTYVPFPKYSRRHSMTGPHPLPEGTSLISSMSSPNKRPSLLDVLRCSFDNPLKNHTFKNKKMLKRSSSSPLENSDRTNTTGTLTTVGSVEHAVDVTIGLNDSKEDARHQAIPAATQEQDDDAEYLESTKQHLDEINAQTELFNRQSKERLLDKMRQEEEELRKTRTKMGLDVSARSSASDPPANSRPGLTRGYSERSTLRQEEELPRRPRIARGYSERISYQEAKQPLQDEPKSWKTAQRRKSFTLGESMRSLSASVNSLCSGGGDDYSEGEFDVNSVLWDSDEEDDDGDDNCTVATRRSAATSAF